MVNHKVSKIPLTLEYLKDFMVLIYLFQYFFVNFLYEQHFF